jgi:hypothetical protein
MSDEAKQWWQTFPAIITALATLLGAVTAFLVALNQSGWHKEPEKKSTPLTEVVTVEKSALPLSPENNNFSFPTPATSQAAMTLTQDITPETSAQQSENTNVPVPPRRSYWPVAEAGESLSPTLPRDMALGTIVNVNQVDGRKCRIGPFGEGRDHLDLRSGPGDSYSLLKKLPAGERLLRHVSWRQVTRKSGAGFG